MPRNYVRKSERATKYTQEDLETAVEKVKNKELTNYAAAKLFNIPTSTLNDRVLAKKGLKSNTMGRPPVLSMETETRLANCLRTLEKWGFGLSREEVFDVVTEFIKKINLNTPFKNDKPGPDWFIDFRKRHRLSIKKPQSVEYLRKRMINPFIISEYFSLLKKTLKELNIDDPKLIWNLDETSICLDPSKTKVVGGKGLPCCRTTNGKGKENKTAPENVPVKITSVVTIENLECKACNISTFEDLLLEKMQQQCRNDPKKNAVKIKRITKGAEVITRTFLEKKKSMEVTLDKKTVKKSGNLKKRNQNTTKKSKNNKSTPTIISNIASAIPGCSNENKNAKRKPETVYSVQTKKKRLADSSDTEVSGTVSIHSDSDIFNIEDDEYFREAKRTERNTNSNTYPISDEYPCDPDYVNPRIVSGQEICKTILKESDVANVLQETDTDDTDILHDEKSYDIILDKSSGQFVPFKKWTKSNKKKYCFKIHDQYNENIRKDDIASKTENDIENFKETYHVKDSVLVRYYNRKWM